MKVMLSENLQPWRTRSMTLYRSRLSASLRDLQPDAEIKVLHGPDQDGKGKLRYQYGRWYAYPRKVRKLHPDSLLHVCDQSYGELCAAYRGPSVVTVHDLIPLRMKSGQIPGRISAPAWLLFKRAMEGICSARQVIAVSQSTADDLIGIYPELSSRITVIGHGVDKVFFRPSPDFRNEEWVVGHVGNCWGYKNIQMVLKITLEVAERATAVGRSLRFLKIGDSLPPQIKNQLVAANVEVEETYAQPDSLAPMLQRMGLLLYPSLWEGFGWPPLEAMAAGVPVLVSQCGALGQYAVPGAAVVLADAHHLQSSELDTITSILEEEVHWQEASQKGRNWVEQFTWSRTVAETIKVYGAV